MANVKINQLPSGNYNAKVYDYTDQNGKRHYKSLTARTKSEVKLMIADFLSTRKIISDHKSINDMLLSDAIDKYIALKENILSPSTIAGYRKIRRNYCKDLQDLRINDLTTERLQASLNRDALSLSPKTLRNNYSFITAVCGYYMPSKRFSLTYPQIKRTVIDLPNPQDIYHAVKGTNIEIAVMLAMWLSLRMSEIRGLRYSDINDGYLTIRHVVLDIDGVPTERDVTKTRLSTRRLKIPQYLLDLIGSGDGYVVPYTANALKNKFSRLQVKAGITPISFHKLRHICASVMVMLGVPDKYAMERGGWSSNGVLTTIYQHTFSDERNAVDSKIDDYFNSILDTD